MNPLFSIAGGVAGTALGGLFGGRRNTTGQDQMAAAYAGLGRTGQQYGGLFQRGQDLSNLGMSGYQDQLARVRQLLEADPYTDSYRTGRINQATQGVGSAYQQAGANLSSNLAQRGLSDSGLMAGGLANLEASRASALAAPMAQLGVEAGDRRQNNALQLLDLLNGVQGQGTQLQQQATQGQAGIYGQQAALGQARQGIDDEQYGGYLQTLGGFGQGLGSLFGGMFTKKKKAGAI